MKKKRGASIWVLIGVCFGFQAGAQEGPRVSESRDEFVIVPSPPLSGLQEFAGWFHQDWAWDFPDRAWEYSDLLESARSNLDGMSIQERTTLRIEMRDFLDSYSGVGDEELADAWYGLGAYFPPRDQVKEALDDFYEMI